ncbi:transposase, partial [Enterovirga aerilata]|nr:transposase [Enterovirga sp. DB1703]
MPRHRPPYPAEFRRQLVDLVRSGRTPEELSREFEPTAQAIWNWVRQADRDGGVRRDEGLPSAEREELSRLRRENRQLRQEREPEVGVAISWQRRQPGSRGRPVRSRPDLPVHERAPGRLPDRRHGARARR